LLEAASFEKPVIACEAEGPSEVIVPGHTGLLVPQDDAGGLARAIEALFDGTIDRRAMGAAAARHVADHFSAAHHCHRLEAVFDDAVARSRSKTAAAEQARRSVPAR